MSLFLYYDTVTVSLPCEIISDDDVGGGDDDGDDALKPIKKLISRNLEV